MGYDISAYFFKKTRNVILNIPRNIIITVVTFILFNFLLFLLLLFSI